MPSTCFASHRPVYELTISPHSHSPKRHSISHNHHHERRRSVSPVGASRQPRKSVQVQLAEQQVQKKMEQEQEDRRKEQEALARIEARHTGRAVQPNAATSAGSGHDNRWVGHGDTTVSNQQSHHHHHHDHHRHHHDRHENRFDDKGHGKGEPAHQRKGEATHAYPLIVGVGGKGKGIGEVR
jgi:hypothetical protein